MIKVKKPKNFPNNEILDEKISPEEFDTWVRYVQEVRFEEEKRLEDEERIRLGDIKVMVFLFHHDEDDLNPPNGANAEIQVTTQLRDDGWYRNDITLKFSSIFAAIETFENYAMFKNAAVKETEVKGTEKNWQFFTHRNSFSMYSK